MKNTQIDPSFHTKRSNVTINRSFAQLIDRTKSVEDVAALERFQKRLRQLNAKPRRQSK